MLGLSTARFGAFYIAVLSPNGVTDLKLDRSKTFNGEPGGGVSTGGLILNDPIDLKARAARGAHYRRPLHLETQLMVAGTQNRKSISRRTIRRSPYRGFEKLEVHTLRCR